MLAFIFSERRQRKLRLRWPNLTNISGSRWAEHSLLGLWPALSKPLGFENFLHGETLYFSPTPSNEVGLSAN